VGIVVSVQGDSWARSIQHSSLLVRTRSNVSLREPDLHQMSQLARCGRPMSSDQVKDQCDQDQSEREPDHSENQAHGH
jgi:hypothetical protein